MLAQHTGLMSTILLTVVESRYRVSVVLPQPIVHWPPANEKSHKPCAKVSRLNSGHGLHTKIDPRIPVTERTKLAQTTVAISGGCGDIGQAVARRLIEEGARVILLDRSPKDLLSADLLNNASVTYQPCDVTDRDAVQSALTESLKGHDRLDVVIANAGIVMNEPFLQINPAHLRTTLEVNFYGAFNLAQLAARLMVSQNPVNGIRGKVLFTGSWVQDMPFPQGTSYICSKSAVKMMAMVMAQELASQGIRVNVLAPGIVYAGLSKKLHDMQPDFRDRVSAAIPLNEMQTAESVADGYAFLCSRDSDYMTGSTLLIDGGATLVKRI
jgi:NAD(P)-dependent dehydrogenase (short-subunit alcohol dehydrogenase family)